MRKLHEGRHARINVLLCVHNVHVWGVQQLCTAIHKQKKIAKTDNNLWAVWLVFGERSFPHHDLWSLIKFLSFNTFNLHCGDHCEIIDKISCKSTSDSALLCRWSIRIYTLYFQEKWLQQNNKEDDKLDSFRQNMRLTAGGGKLYFGAVWSNQFIIFTAWLYMDNLYNLNKCMMYNILQNDLDITTAQRNLWVLVGQLLTLWIDGRPNRMLWIKV